jgi:hypothetical protein
VDTFSVSFFLAKDSTINTLFSSGLKLTQTSTKECKERTAAAWWGVTQFLIWSYVSHFWYSCWARAIKMLMLCIVKCHYILKFKGKSLQE